jgi:hypothetical protein
MNLVPENINEAIKHLKPRSEEEMFKNKSNQELFDMWNDHSLYINGPEEKMIYDELKKRGAKKELDFIKMRIHVPRYFIDESIKHLTGRSKEEIEEFEECKKILTKWKEIDNHVEEIAIYQLLKNKNAVAEIEYIESTAWFDNYLAGNFGDLQPLA